MKSNNEFKTISLAHMQ